MFYKRRHSNTMIVRRLFRRFLIVILYTLTISTIIYQVCYQVKFSTISDNITSFQCVIPKLSPDFLNPKYDLPPPKCYNISPPLFTIDFENRLLRQKVEPPYKCNASKCFYQQLKRHQDRPDFEYVDNTAVTDIVAPVTTLKADVEHLRIWCNCTSEPNQGLIYEDYLSAVQIKPEVEESLDEIRMEEEFYSVLIISQDSSSHMNFLRTMPRVHDFLINTMEAIEFHGFNSLGPTTFWSFDPLVTGLDLLEFNTRCYGNGSYKDSCPFIWKEFEKSGYRTVFDEDQAASSSLFKYVGTHPFLRQPFHYDFRVVSRKLETMQKSSQFCFGSRLSFSVLLENMLRVAKKFHRKPYWAMFWASALSHFENSLSKYAEPSLLYSLEYLHQNQLLNNTILIMLSDHGMWSRDFQNGSDHAFMEQRLPLLYMVLPQNFKEKYSVAFKNLKDNVHRLVTAFDLHATMKDLLSLEHISNKRLEKRARQLGLQENRNISLFLPISATRTCALAGISLINCACVPRHSMSILDPIVIEAAKSVVGILNEKLAGYEQCSHLELANITEVFVTGVQSPKGIGQGLIDNFVKERNARAVKRSHGDYFEIGINTRPGRGKYYVAVVVNGFDGEVTIDGIARVSIYGHDADCMPVLELRPYCYCKTGS